MNASKRLTLRILKTSHTSSSLNYRRFHASSICLAGYHRLAKPARTHYGAPLTNEKIQRSLPPAGLIIRANADGLIDLQPKSVNEFLENYMEAAVSKMPGWEKKVTEYHSISLTALTVIAGILNHAPNHEQQDLAAKLTISAAALGSVDAAETLILTALKLSIPIPPAATKLLQRLVAEKDPFAMALYGKVLMSEGKHAEALKYLDKALEPPDGNLKFKGVGDALCDKGRLLLILRDDDKSLAKQAFKTAALMFDEPLAYYYFARWHPEGSNEEKLYLAQAASSGIHEAASILAERDLKTLFDSMEGLPKSIEGYGLAGEWIRVAAESGSKEGGIHMACMFKSVGDLREWNYWKEKLRDSGGAWSPNMKRAKDMWAEKKVEFWS